MAKKKPKYYVRPDGLHEAIRTVNGKRVAFRGKTDREVEQKMVEYTAKMEKGRLFSEVAEEWESIHFPTLAPNSKKNYAPALKRAIAEFGDTPVKDIKPPTVKAFINEFSRGRARKTVSTQLLVTSLAFNYAVSEGEMEYNPCASITVPKNLPQTHRQAASPEDEAKVKASAHIWLYPYLILYTGLRRGEAMALTYDDIDLDNKVIHVTKSVYYESDAPLIKQPKTAAGVRTVPIFDPLAKVLPKKKGPQYLFSRDGGASPIRNGAYTDLYNAYRKEVGITATAHQLRHSYATILYELDVDPKIAQNLLGHSTEAMTREIYTHLRADKLATATKDINKRITKRETQTRHSEP